MNIQEIPLTPDNQQFSITLGGKSWRMQLLWRDIAGWILDIHDSNNTPLLTGVPLIPETNLLAQYPFLPFDGMLVMTCSAGTPEYPTQYNLGAAARFYFIQELQ